MYVTSARKISWTSRNSSTTALRPSYCTNDVNPRDSTKIVPRARNKPSFVATIPSALKNTCNGFQIGNGLRLVVGTGFATVVGLVAPVVDFLPTVLVPSVVRGGGTTSVRSSGGSTSTLGR